MSLIVIISLLAISFNSIPSLAIFFFHSAELGKRLCSQISHDLNTCPTVDFPEVNRIFNDRDYRNITTPRVSIITSADSFNFNVTLKNGRNIPKVRDFRMMAEGTEVDIDLLHPSSYSIKCWSYGPFLKVASNIMTALPWYKKFEVLKKFRPYSEVSIYKGNMQSGQFTCGSKKDQNYSETFRIFTQPSALNEGSPFVPVRDLSIQSDDTGNGFIVPCRTKYRMERAPELLWSKYEWSKSTMLTAEEMKNFGWDPFVGFQFNRSNTRMWEMERLTCRFGSFNTSFLPTTSRFKTFITVKAEGNQLSCGLGPRNVSSELLLDSQLVYQKATYYECKTSFDCDLELASGEHMRTFRDIAAEENSFGAYILDLHKPSGVVSCFSQHIYNGNIVPEVESRVVFAGLDSNVYLLPGSYPNSSVIQITQVDGPIYINGTEWYHDFTCTTHSFLTALGVDWKSRYKDMTDSVELHLTHFSNYPDQSAESTIGFRFQTNLTHVICLCFTQDGTAMSAESPLHIYHAFAPRIENVTSNSRTFKAGHLKDNVTLTCPITGGPPPEYQWSFNENIDVKNAGLVQGVHTKHLIFGRMYEELAGNYTCEAWNEYGNNSFEFHVSVQASDTPEILNGKIHGKNGTALIDDQGQALTSTPSSTGELGNGLATGASTAHHRFPAVKLDLFIKIWIVGRFVSAHVLKI